jgi:DNA-binding IclR family transcriptional regulator
MEQREFGAYGRGDLRLAGLAALAATANFTRIRAQHVMSDIGALSAQGYAALNQAYMRHIVGAAVPVATPEGKLLAALSVSALNVRASLEYLGTFVPQLHLSAAACLARLGKRHPEVKRPTRVVCTQGAAAIG